MNEGNANYKVGTKNRYLLVLEQISIYDFFNYYFTVKVTFELQISM